MSRLIVAHCLAAIVATVPAIAQQGDKQRAVTTAGRPIPAVPPTWIKASAGDDKLSDIDFPGGPVGEYFRGLSARWPDLSGKLIATVEVESVTLPAFELNGIDRMTALRIPSQLVGGIQFTNYDSTPGMANSGFFFRADSSLMQITKNRQAAAFDLDFQGGSVGEYVEAIRKVCPGANIVMMQGAEKMSVPAVKFRAVTVGAAMRAIERQERGLNGAHSALIVRSIGVEGSSESVFKVEVESTPAGPIGAESVHVWSLAPSIAAGVKVEDALSAIDAALAVDQRPVTIKYHEATNLLIVRATEQQHKVIDDVIHEVEYTVKVREGAKETK